MTHELHEVISLRNRFRALKAEMDLVHHAWQTAVRECDFNLWGSDSPKLASLA